MHIYNLDICGLHLPIGYSPIFCSKHMSDLKTILSSIIGGQKWFGRLKTDLQGCILLLMILREQAGASCSTRDVPLLRLSSFMGLKT